MKSAGWVKRKQEFQRDSLLERRVVQQLERALSEGREGETQRKNRLSNDMPSLSHSSSSKELLPVVRPRGKSTHLDVNLLQAVDLARWKDFQVGRAFAVWKICPVTEDQADMVESRRRPGEKHSHNLFEGHLSEQHIRGNVPVGL